jgi:hypothetical protein
MTTDIFCFYFQNRLIQTSQTGGQRHSDTSPFPLVRVLHENRLEGIARDKHSSFMGPFVNYKENEVLSMLS